MDIPFGPIVESKKTSSFDEIMRMKNKIKNYPVKVKPQLTFVKYENTCDLVSKINHN